MATYSFFYFIGFITTFLGTSWRPTLLINVVIFIIAELFFFTSGFNLKPVALLIGWASAVLIPSHFLFVQAEVFAMTTATHMNLLVFTLEIATFVLSTALVFSYDNSPFIWMIMMAIHAVYVFMLMHLSNQLDLIKRESVTKINYYAMLISGLLVSDLVYMMSSAALNHGSTLASTGVAAGAAFCFSFVLDFMLHRRSSQESFPPL